MSMGARVRCGGCTEVVYEDCLTLRNHYIYFDPETKRMVWYSLDFEVEVHRCADEICDPSRGGAYREEPVRFMITGK